MHIVFLTNKDSWDIESYYAPTRVHALKAISKLIKVDYAGAGWGVSGKSVSQIIQNFDKADFVVLQGKRKQCIVLSAIDYVSDEKLFAEYQGKKVLLLDEAYNFRWTISKILNTKIQYVVNAYSQERDVYEGRGIIRGVKWQNIPHCASTEVFKDYKEPKTIDVLLTGSITTHYPFRQRLRNLIEHRLSKICRCRIISKNERRTYVLEKYARLINSSKITLSCSSTYRYRLAKYVEIPLCGSLLMADLPYEDENFLSSFSIELERSDSDDTLVEKIMYYVNHDEEREKKIQLGMELNQKYYSQEVYAERFVKTLEGWM